MASGVRIAGGTLRGRRLAVGSGVRPTEIRVREALASMWGPLLEEARVLDLFAGSGAVGVECLSRGASAVVFVEAAPRTARALQQAVRALDLGDRARVVRGSVPSACRRLRGPFDLVFADPPYALEAFEPVLRAAAGLLADPGEITLEHPPSAEIPDLVLGGRSLFADQPGRPALERFDVRRYGGSVLSRFRAIDDERARRLQAEAEQEALHAAGDADPGTRRDRRS